ncbi:hypothetical protein ACK1GW_004813 [Salmonella enterica]
MCHPGRSPGQFRATAQLLFFGLRTFLPHRDAVQQSPDAVLVMNNVRESEKVPGLVLEDRAK